MKAVRPTLTALALLLGGTTFASAATVTITWTPPTANTYDQESDASNVATSAVPFPRPKAPTATSATP